MDQEAHVEPWPANPEGGHKDNGSWPLLQDRVGNKAPTLVVAQAANEESVYAETIETFLKMLKRLQEQDPIAKLWSSRYKMNQGKSAKVVA